MAIDSDLASAELLFLAAHDDDPAATASARGRELHRPGAADALEARRGNAARTIFTQNRRHVASANVLPQEQRYELTAHFHQRLFLGAGMPCLQTRQH